MTAAVDRLLQQLQSVRRTGPGKWIACCPAHEDQHPSLSIADAHGTVLLKCWAGCTADEIVCAVGLQMQDLFPPRSDAPGAGRPPARRPWLASDLLALASFESTVVIVIVADLVAGRDADIRRLHEASRRLMLVVEAASGKH